MIIKIDIPSLTRLPVPTKHNPPLQINTDRVLIFQMAGKLFESVAWRRTQIFISARIIDHLQLAKQARFNLGWYLLAADVMKEEIFQPVIAKTADYVLMYRSLGQ